MIFILPQRNPSCGEHQLAIGLQQSQTSTSVLGNR